MAGNFEQEVCEEEVLQDEAMQDEAMQDEAMLNEMLEKGASDEEVPDESTTYSNEDLLRMFDKNKINIGQEYHFTGGELSNLIKESEKIHEELQEQYDKALYERESALKRGDATLISKAKRDLRRVEHLCKMEQPMIKAAAIEIMKHGDPVDYIIKVYNRLHVGDTGIGKVMLLSIACQSILNSEGLQPKLSGASGKGKTHAVKAMFHLIPDLRLQDRGELICKIVVLPS
jgi:hypothetical protein